MYKYVKPYKKICILKQRVAARRLQRRLEFFTLTTQSDGFSGSTVVETSMGYYWAEIASVNSDSRQASNIVAMGINDFSGVFKITMRYYSMFLQPKKIRIKKADTLYEIINVSVIDERGTKVELTIKERAR